MKITLTIILLSLISSLAAQPFVRVSNNPGAIADYTNLQTAITNAPIGATIFVEPSATSYGAITITKKITLLGGGYDATKHNNKSSQLSSISFNALNGNPNNSVISGFLINGNLTSSGIDNVTLQKCQFNSTYGVNLNGSTADSVVGWKIINCKLSLVGASCSRNILISNNLIYNVSSTIFNNNTIQIANNVFQNSAGSGNTFVIYSNNIFYTNIPTTCSKCNFANNLTKQGLSTLIYGDNVSTSNIEGIATTNIFVTYSTDLHLKSTCPGVNAGTDGKDIGIYGGLYPFPAEDYGIIGYPDINSISISNPVIEPNGTLKVNIKSKIIH